MATRLYLANAAPPVSPGFTAGWELTTGAIRRTLEDAKGQPDSAYETRGQATTLNVPAGAVDVLLAQYTSAQLSANVTISGAIRGQIRAFESNAAADLDLQCVLWVMKTDGTARGTLFTFDATALAHEFNTALRNISIPKGGSATPTSVAAQATDRIVLELGYRKHESATTSRTGTIESGNPTGTDLPVDETTTTQGVPWIEFTEALSFTQPFARASQVSSEFIIANASPFARVSQVSNEFVIANAAPFARVSQVSVEWVIPRVPAVISGGETGEVIWLGEE